MSDRMLVRLKKTAATACVTAVAVVAVAAPANAQTSDGLINVTIGDITLEDVRIGVAAAVAANICGVQVGPIVLEAREVDATSTQRTVCESDVGDVVFTQNAA
jgi:hypothetical protein